MLIISKVFTILCLLCLCGNRVGNTLVAFKTNLSSKLSLTYGGNVKYYKSVHHPILILPVGTGNTLGIFKTNQ